MAKRIIVLSDGTGNSAATVWRTNVWRTFEALNLTGSDQIAFYDDGVGTSSFKPTAILGGAFGFGLKRNVIDLYKFLSADRTDASYGRYVDRQLDSLYDRQARARDPEERRKLIREFEKRLLDDQAHIIPTLFWYRVVPHNVRVRGWTITPSHFLNQQLDGVWLAE